MFIHINGVSFHLWWKDNSSKQQKFWKYYDHGYLGKIIFFLTAQIIKKIISSLEFTLSLKRGTGLTWKHLQYQV